MWESMDLLTDSGETGSAQQGDIPFPSTMQEGCIVLEMAARCWGPRTLPSGQFPGQK
jgi:hypothetical protein